VLVSRPVLIISRFTRAEPVEQLLDLCPRLPSARRESGDNRQETVAGQRLQLQVGGRPNHGSTRHPAQQRNLSKPIPWAELGHHATVTNHIGRTRLDDIEAVSWITLAKTAWPPATWTGSKPRASCSIAGSGNG